MRPREIFGFRLGEFGTAFPGFGGGGSGQPRRKRTKKKYIVSSIDPMRPGSIAAAGVPEQQVSSRKSIYGRIDIQLRKSRPKERKPKKDPFRL